MGKKSRLKRERKEQLPRWTPFELYDPDKRVADEEFSMWVNSRYVVLRRRVKAREEGWPDMVHLSIRRYDRAPIMDWRDLQRVKNELVGEECEGLQLFPAESRLVDSSNQYHLYVIEKPGLMFPVGYQERLVSEAEVDGSRQRPFEEKPPDLISQERMERIRAAYDKLPGEPVKGPN